MSEPLPDGAEWMPSARPPAPLLLPSKLQRLPATFRDRARCLMLWPLSSSVSPMKNSSGLCATSLASAPSHAPLLLLWVHRRAARPQAIAFRRMRLLILPSPVPPLDCQAGTGFLSLTFRCNVRLWLRERLRRHVGDRDGMGWNCHLHPLPPVPRGTRLLPVADDPTAARCRWLRGRWRLRPLWPRIAACSRRTALLHQMLAHHIVSGSVPW